MFRDGLVDVVLRTRQAALRPWELEAGLPLHRRRADALHSVVAPLLGAMRPSRQPPTEVVHLPQIMTTPRLK